MGNRRAQERVARIRGLDRHHDFTLVLPDLSSIAHYARVGNAQFRLIRQLTPGPYTFIFAATRKVPKRLLHPRRRSIGIRVPGNPIAHGLLGLLDEALVSSSLLLPNQDMDYLSLEELLEQIENQVDVIIDGGPCPMLPTSVLDLRESAPVVLRKGAGDVEFLTG
jgi:tRNA threonylcarbamoyl adenosine modification protein (Sua5/YciO/YrdC/YwlC family)